MINPNVPPNLESWKRDDRTQHFARHLEELHALLVAQAETANRRMQPQMALNCLSESAVVRTILNNFTSE